MVNYERTVSESETSFVDLLKLPKIIYKRRVLVVATALIITIIGAVASFLTPNFYKSQATLLPIENNEGSNLSSLLGSLSGSIGVIGNQAGLTGGGASDKFITILESRTIAESVIQNLNLLPIIFENQWDSSKNQWKRGTDNEKDSANPTLQDGVEKLSKMISFTKEKKSGLITIEATTTDPELSASLANAYSTELENYLKNNALSSAKRNRVFVEDQLSKAKIELAELEITLKDFQTKNKVISIDAQTEASIKAYTDIKSKLLSAEIEYKLLKNGGFPEDPRISLKNQEITELRNQLKNFEDNTGANPTISFGKAPSLGLSLARLKRDIIIREKVLELLTQKYEVAKIQESEDDISFQVLDHAISPDKKSGPNRTRTTLIIFVASVMLGMLLALALEYWQSLQKLAIQST